MHSPRPPPPVPRTNDPLLPTTTTTPNALFVDEPVALIEVDDEGVFGVNAKALAMLRSLNGPVAVLAVAGLYVKCCY